MHVRGEIAMDLKFRKLGLSGKDKRHRQTELYIAREQPELREQKRSPKEKKNLHIQ